MYVPWFEGEAALNEANQAAVLGEKPISVRSLRLNFLLALI
jgi:hypothetical protein